MSEPDGFLGRWSRRKREAATPEPTARATPAADAAIEAAPDPDAITPEELADVAEFYARREPAPGSR